MQAGDTPGDLPYLVEWHNQRQPDACEGPKLVAITSTVTAGYPLYKRLYVHVLASGSGLSSATVVAICPLAWAACKGHLLHK